MNMKTLNHMIKYLSYLLVNSQTVIYKKLLLAKCRAEYSLPTFIQLKDSPALQRGRSSPENHLSYNNHTVFKSLRRIINFYSYQDNQCLLANILNTLQRKNSFKNYLFCNLI